MGKHWNPISDILTEHAVTTPGKAFIIDLLGEQSISYSDFNDSVNTTCSFLLSRGMKKGDRIAVVLKNGLEFLLLLTASIRMGYVFCPFPDFLTDNEIGKDLEYYNPVLVITEEGREEEFSARFPYPSISMRSGFHIHHHSEKSPHVTHQTVSPDDPVCIYYSGGGDDEPRGIQYSHNNIISLILSINNDFQFGEDSNHLLVLPLAHTAALNYTFFPMLFAGGSLVLAPDFWTIRNDFWKIIDQYKVSYTQVVPSILRMLLQQNKHPGKRGRMEYIGCGSAPLEEDLQIRFEKEFGLPAANLYGLSETGPTHADLPTRGNWIRGGIGKPLGVNQVIIADDEGNELARGEEGEIAVKGKNVFPGYFINSVSMASFFKNGYFMTGDIGTMDEASTCFFIRRKKNIIIKGGHNIYPKEIDQVLMRHPDVISAETKGKKDHFLGELIESSVVVKDGSELTLKELRNFCVPHLSFLKIPDIVHFSPE